MTTVGTSPRVTVTVAVALGPNALVQMTGIVLEPTLSATELVETLVELEPFTVQVVPAGIDEAPLTVYTTLVVAAVVLLLLAGAVIATTGTDPRLTTTDAAALVPNELVQDTGMVFAPTASATELVAVLVELAPLTVQVVPAGIDDPPLTV
jgi:hypothetical protein